MSNNSFAETTYKCTDCGTGTYDPGLCNKCLRILELERQLKDAEACRDKYNAQAKEFAVLAASRKVWLEEAEEDLRAQSKRAGTAERLASGFGLVLKVRCLQPDACDSACKCCQLRFARADRVRSA